MSARRRIGVALGSGSARGWAHIGVLRELAASGIVPDVVCGTSVGALVGAAWALGRLDEFEKRVRALRMRDVLGLLDLRVGRGGLVSGERLLAELRNAARETTIESLPAPFGSVATDLHTGREVWLKSGSLFQAVRASTAIPGLLLPSELDGRWLVDGGLVNPVPVTLCRALGADIVIAVNLNADVAARSAGLRTLATGEVLDLEAGRRRRGRARRRPLSGASEAGSAQPVPAEGGPVGGAGDLVSRLSARFADLRDRAALLGAGGGAARLDRRGPGLLDVLVASIHIMQDRIARSRLAGDPPDLLLHPQLAHVRLLDFGRAEETIAEGAACVQRSRQEIERLTGAG